MMNSNIDHGKIFDWGRASKEYARYRDIYPDTFYEQIAGLGLCVNGQNVLDLGTGTGVLPRNMIRYGASFTGADVSENQIDEARKLTKECGMDINYVVSSAENIIFPDKSFDVVTACQCHIYFDESVVLPKIHNMLKDNGHYCILWMAWLPLEDEIAGASEELILKYNPEWSGARTVRHDLKNSFSDTPLFSVEHSLLYDVKLPFTRESWNGRIKACRGIGASSLSEQEISEFECEHFKLLEQYPENFEVLHYVSVLVLKKQSLQK